MFLRVTRILRYICRRLGRSCALIWQELFTRHRAHRVQATQCLYCAADEEEEEEVEEEDHEEEREGEGGGSGWGSQSQSLTRGAQSQRAEAQGAGVSGSAPRWGEGAGVRALGSVSASVSMAAYPAARWLFPSPGSAHCLHSCRSHCSTPPGGCCILAWVGLLASCCYCVCACYVHCFTCYKNI